MESSNVVSMLAKRLLTAYEVEVADRALGAAVILRSLRTVPLEVPELSPHIELVDLPVAQEKPAALPLALQSHTRRSAMQVPCMVLEPIKK